MTAEGQRMPFLDQKVAEKLAEELAKSMRVRVGKKLGIDKPREKSVTEQMEEIMEQLRRILQEKEKLAKSTFDSSSDKGLLSQKKLSVFLDYLNESWRDAKSFFEEKNIEGLQFILSEVQESTVIENKLEKVVIPEGEEKSAPLSEEAKEAEKIMAELGTVISEKKALFEAESVRLSASPEVLSQNMAFLDRMAKGAQKAFDSGNVKGIRAALKLVRQTQFWLNRSGPIATGKPEGVMPDVDPSKVVSPYGNLSTTTVEEPEVTIGAGEVESKNLKERLYEELETSVTKAKKKQYESVVTEGMAPFVEHAEQNLALTLQATIDQHGGVEKVARAFAKVLEVILPNSWSDADRKLFAFVFTKKQIEDLFE